jgi:phytanoyl-CoA hydroxylase
MSATPSHPSFDLRRYERDGYAVLPGFRSPAACKALRERTAQIVEAFDPAPLLAGGQGVFSTLDAARSAQRWFLESADQVRCFLEAEALGDDGRLTLPKARAVNKIGHALHELDPAFRAFSRGPDLHAVARAAGLEQPRVWQSMVIVKPPSIGGEVRWHQDATYLLTTPVTVTTFWFALEDARLDNGCLWVQPGGHRGPLRERFVRESTAPEDRVALERLDDLPWPRDDEAVPLECDQGTLVVFHGLLPHWSSANRSARSRLAYTLHATCATSAYADTNWIQRRDPARPVRGFVD